VLRETWDYHHRLDEFMGWIEQVEKRTTLLNSPGLVRWNAHKTYLRDLEANGVPIVPTIWLEAGTQANFRAEVLARGWQRQQVVIKPTVSASAFETLLFSEEDAARAQEHIGRLLPSRDLMLQPFLPSVQAYGERSLMFIDGTYTHAVRRPEPFMGDDIPYESRPAQATADEIAFASSVLDALPETPLYARVDIAPDAEQLRLMELELIEPSLFFKFSPRAVTLMADGIERRFRALAPA
jgi:hypothetical protein